MVDNEVEIDLSINMLFMYTKYRLYDHDICRGKSKRVRAAQWFLHGSLKTLCQLINTKITLAETGKGLVIFLFSNGFFIKTCVKVKYARYFAFVNTFDSDPKKFTDGEDINGYSFVNGFKQSDLILAMFWKDNILQLANEYSYHLFYRIIDALLPL